MSYPSQCCVHPINSLQMFKQLYEQSRPVAPTTLRTPGMPTACNATNGIILLLAVLMPTLHFGKN